MSSELLKKLEDERKRKEEEKKKGDSIVSTKYLSQDLVFLTVVKNQRIQGDIRNLSLDTVFVV